MLLAPFRRRLSSLRRAAHRAMATAQVPLVCVRNTQPMPAPAAKAAFLESFERCPFITARTVAINRVLELDNQVLRLAHSAQMILREAHKSCEEDEAPTVAVITDRERLRPAVLDSMRAALRAFEAANPDCGTTERRITCILSFNFRRPTSFDLFTLVELMPPVAQPPIVVQVRAEPPEHKNHPAGAKDTQWVQDRKGLDAQRGTANEVVLASSAGELLEGLQTNFYAILDGQVMTAMCPEVLPGTIRAVVLRVCERHGIRVVPKGPSIGQLAQLQGAFLTSTSRLVLPIDTLEVHADASGSGDSSPQVYAMPGCSLLQRLCQLVAEEIVASATPVEQE